MAVDVRILSAGVAEVERAAAAGIDDLCEFVADEARRHAAVGDPQVDNHSGRLRDSIHVRHNADGSTEVVADAPEAPFNEFGTANMPAQPFMTPGLQAGLAHTQDIVGGRMARELR